MLILQRLGCNERALRCCCIRALLMLRTDCMKKQG